MTTAYIDTHFHPFELPLMDNIEFVITQAIHKHVMYGIGAGVDAKTSEQVVAFSRKFSFIKPAIGLHPWYSDQVLEPSCFTELLDENPHIVAMGEIGLDGRIEIPIDRQKKVFIEQLEIAQQYQLPVIVHSRGAVNQCYEILKDFVGLTKVLHSFGGSAEQAFQFLDQDCYFSISGTVTRANAKKVKTLVKQLPMEKLCLETDAPAIHVEGIEKGMVEPKHIPIIARAIADIKEVHQIDLARVIYKTTCRLFAIHE